MLRSSAPAGLASWPKTSGACHSDPFAPCHSDPALAGYRSVGWIPAFAGMTTWGRGSRPGMSPPRKQGSSVGPNFHVFNGGFGHSHGSEESPHLSNQASTEISDSRPHERYRDIGVQKSELRRPAAAGLLPSTSLTPRLSLGAVSGVEPGEAEQRRSLRMTAQLESILGGLLTSAPQR
jgi:hypothetical protein